MNKMYKNFRKKSFLEQAIIVILLGLLCMFIYYIIYPPKEEGKSVQKTTENKNTNKNVNPQEDVSLTDTVKNAFYGVGRALGIVQTSEKDEALAKAADDALYWQRAKAVFWYFDTYKSMFILAIALCLMGLILPYAIIYGSALIRVLLRILSWFEPIKALLQLTSPYLGVISPKYDSNIFLNKKEK